MKLVLILLIGLIILSGCLGSKDPTNPNIIDLAFYGMANGETEYTLWNYGDRLYFTSEEAMENFCGRGIGVFGLGRGRGLSQYSIGDYYCQIGLREKEPDIESKAFWFLAMEPYSRVGSDEPRWIFMCDYVGCNSPEELEEAHIDWFRRQCVKEGRTPKLDRNNNWSCPYNESGDSNK